MTSRHRRLLNSRWLARFLRKLSSTFLPRALLNECKSVVHSTKSGSQIGGAKQMPNPTDATIFMIGADNALTELAPTQFLNEDEFQQPLAAHPALLRLAAGADGDLLLIAREAGVADQADAADRWALDHLFLNREGVPVLVEVKRATDTRARREVVAQMLDYASHGTAYWKAGDIQAMYQKTTTGAEDADSKLNQFLGEREPEAFWQQVEANLQAGRVRMLFVADKIGGELRRIVEFLNRQMRPAEVLAVEISQFKNANGVRSIVPRLFGATEQATSVKSATGAPDPRSNEEWLTDFAKVNGEPIGAVARKLAGLLIGAGLTMRVVPTGKSAAFDFAVEGHPLTRGMFSLIVNPAGLQLAVRAFAEYPSFQTDASRADVVKQIQALGLTFRTLPPVPANSWPTVPLKDLAAEAAFVKFNDYLLSLLGRARSLE
jgi:hypothetical protein